MDDFFTNVKLMKALKDIGIGTCGIAKAGSGFPVELLQIRELSTKKKNWEMRTYTAATSQVLCFVWQDLGTTQIMTTVHSASNLEKLEFIPKEIRQGIIPNDSMLQLTNGNMALPIPFPIRKYNKHMGGSDANSQCRSYYSADTCSFRYWWPLFKLLLDGAVLNAFNLWKILESESTLSHLNFQHRIATKLVQNSTCNQSKICTPSAGDWT